MSYYPSEIHFIFELQLQAERYFPKASFSLYVSTSPEDGSKTLFFKITHHWQTSAQEAFDLMEKFADEWYVPNMDRAEDLFVIDEFAEMPEEKRETWWM